MSTFKYSYLDVSCNNLMRLSFLCLSQKGQLLAHFCCSSQTTSNYRHTFRNRQHCRPAMVIYKVYIASLLPLDILFLFILILYRSERPDSMNYLMQWQAEAQNAAFLAASGSFTLGWASVLWAKGIKTGTLMVTALICLLRATGTSTLPFTLARFLLKLNFYYQRPYSTRCTGK